MRSSCVLVAVLTALSLPAACADDGGGGRPDAGPGPDSAPATDAAPSPDAITATVVGTIRVAERRLFGTESWQWGEANAQFAAAGLTRWHTEVARAGDCRLLRFELGRCSEYCYGVCLPPGVCIPYPTYDNVGTLTIVGLAEGTRTLLRHYDGNYEAYPYPPADVFAPGVAITASASGGGAFAAFTVSAHGVAPLVSPTITDYQVSIPNGADFTFTWTPGGGAGDRVRLELNSNNQAHGLPVDSIIECDVADTGSLTVPRELIEQFPQTDGYQVCVRFDCPPSRLVLYSRGTVAAAGGEVELLVESGIGFGPAHPAP